jgi:hypothetical protein
MSPCSSNRGAKTSRPHPSLSPRRKDVVAGRSYENRLLLCWFDSANVLVTRNLESACTGTIYHVSSCHVDSELSSEFHF